jgi:hypothetical protein
VTLKLLQVVGESGNEVDGSFISGLRRASQRGLLRCLTVSRSLIEFQVRFHRRDAEDTEAAQRPDSRTLPPLRPRCELDSEESHQRSWGIVHTWPTKRCEWIPKIPPSRLDNSGAACIRQRNGWVQPRRGYDSQPRVAVLSYPRRDGDEFLNPNGVGYQPFPVVTAL